MERVKPRITYRTLDDLSSVFNSVMEAVYEIKADVDDKVVINNLETKLVNRESNKSFCEADANGEIGSKKTIGRGGFSGAGILSIMTPSGIKQIYTPTATRNYDNSEYRKNNYNSELLGIWYMPVIYKAPHLVPDKIYIGRKYPVESILKMYDRKTEQDILDCEKIQKNLNEIGTSNGLWDDNILMSDLLHESTASYLFNVLYQNNISPNSVFVRDYFLCKRGEKIVIEKAGITLSNLLDEHLLEITDEDLFSLTAQVSWLFHNAKNAFDMVSYDCHPDNIMITQTESRIQGVEVISDYMYANQMLSDINTISMDVTKMKGVNPGNVRSVDIKYTGLLAKVIDYGLTEFKIGKTKFDNVSSGFISHSFYNRYDAMRVPYGMETMYMAIHIYLTIMTHYMKYAAMVGEDNNNVMYIKSLMEGYAEKMSLMFTDFTNIVKGLMYVINDKDKEFENQYVRNKYGYVEKTKTKGLLDKGKYFMGARNFVFISDRTLVNTKEIPLQNLCKSITDGRYKYKKNQNSKTLALISWDMYASGSYVKNINKLYLDHEAMHKCVTEGKKIKLSGVLNGNDTIIKTLDGKDVGIYKYCSSVDRSLKQILPNYNISGIRDVVGFDLVDRDTGFLKRNILQSDLDRYKYSEHFPYYKINIVPEDYSKDNNHEIIPGALMRGLQKYRGIVDGKGFKIDRKLALLEQVSINLFYHDDTEVKSAKVYEKTNLLDFATDRPPVNNKNNKYYDSNNAPVRTDNVKYAVFSTGYHIVPNNRLNKLTKRYKFEVKADEPQPIGYFYNTTVYDDGNVTSMNELLPVPYPYIEDYGVLTIKNNKLKLNSYQEFLDMHSTTLEPQIMKVDENRYCIVKTEKILNPRPLIYDAAITLGACLVKNGITYLTDDKLEENCVIHYADIVDKDNFMSTFGDKFNSISEFARVSEVGDNISFIKRSDVLTETLPCYVYTDQRTTKKYSGDEGESLFPYGNRHADSAVPLACICDTFDGRVVIIVTEGRGYHDRGITRFQLAKILPYFNVKNAYSMDGGFSCNIVMRVNDDITYAIPFAEKRNLGSIMVLDYIDRINMLNLPSLDVVRNDIQNIERMHGKKNAAKALYVLMSIIEQYYYKVLSLTKNQEKIKEYEDYRMLFKDYILNALVVYDRDSIPKFLEDYSGITRSSVYTPQYPVENMEVVESDRMNVIGSDRMDVVKSAESDRMEVVTF